MKYYFFLFFFFFSAIAPSRCVAEFHITLNEDEKYAIREILLSIGEKNIAGLLIDSYRLSSLGATIQHIKPLQFLGYILSEPYLKKCLKRGAKSYFKWSAFMDGLSGKMKRELKEGILIDQLSDFARFVGGDPYTLEMFAREEAWDEFVKSLL